MHVVFFSQSSVAHEKSSEQRSSGDPRISQLRWHMRTLASPLHSLTPSSSQLPKIPHAGAAEAESAITTAERIPKAHARRRNTVRSVLTGISSANDRT